MCADLQWEENNGKADHSSDANHHDDNLCVIGCGDHANHVGKGQGEDELQNRKMPKL